MPTKTHPIMLLVAGALMSLLPTAQAYWILGCGRPVVTERLDPIMQPGQVPSSHVHAVMGGNAFSADMPTTENRTQESNCTTCVVTEDLSNYWVPNLYFQDPKNHSFISVKNAGGMNIYYEQRIDPQDSQYSSGIHAFPRGFRMVAGDPYQRNISDPPTLEQRAISFACLSSTPGPQTNNLPDKKCNNGLRVQVSFPSCWDGKNLDSPDHKSHMAYPSLMDNGICPDSHPVRLMYLFYEVMYSVDQFDHLWTEGQGEQPFVFSNGDPTGYGYHGDFLNGWDIALLQKAIDTCGDETGGDIQKCKAFKPYLQDAKEQNKCSKKTTVHEKVLDTLSKLPGCNPIQNGPEKAMPQKC